MDHTKSNIIAILPGVVRQISRLILHILKPNRVNYALIQSNISIARAITRPILTPVLSGITASTRSSILRSIKNSENLGISQFVQLWIVMKDNSQRHQNLLTKCVEKQFNC